MSTTTWNNTGRLEGGKLVYEGLNSDAMTGAKNRWSKSVLDLGDGPHTYTGYHKDEAGQEYVNVEMTATRK